MLINTDLDEDEDFYDEDHDDFEETLEKINEGKNELFRISSKMLNNQEIIIL